MRQIVIFITLAAAFAIVLFGTDLLNRVRLGSTPLPVIDREGIDAVLSDELDQRLATIGEEPYSATAWGELGMVCDVHGLRRPAIDAYHRAAELDPEEVQWVYLAGRVEELERPEDALGTLRRAADLPGASASVFWHAGQATLAAGDLDSAEELFTRATKRSTLLGGIGLAEVWLARDDAKDALRRLELLVSFHSDVSDIHRLRAQALRRLDREDEAIAADRLASEGTALEVDDPLRRGLGMRYGVTEEWVRQRAESHRLIGRPDLGVQAWQEYIERGGSSAESHRELGDLLSAVGDGPRAIDAYRRSLEIDEENALAHFGLGIVLAALEQTEEGIAELERCVELDAENYEARGTLGALLVGAGRTREGIESLKVAAAGLPDRPEAFFNLGMGYRRIGRYSEAVDALQRAVGIDGANFRAQFELGVTLALEERYAEAAEVFGRVVAVEPDRIAAHRNRIRSLLRARESRKALAAVEDALGVFPQEPTLRWQQAWVFAVAEDDTVRDPVRARTLTDTLIRDLGGQLDPELQELLAAVHGAHGEYSAALGAIDLAIEETTDPELLERRTKQRVEYAASRPWRE